MLLGYARVSKEEEQDTRMQETALRAAGVERLFTEHATRLSAEGFGRSRHGPRSTRASTSGRWNPLLLASSDQLTLYETPRT